MTLAKKTKARYFEVAPLLKKYANTRYFFILGGRGTGKTYPVSRLAVADAITGKGLFAYVRRHKDSITGLGPSQIFAVHSDLVEKLTGGRWNRIAYYRRQFFLELWKEKEDGTVERVERSPKPIGVACALTTWETDKGPDYGHDDNIKNIILDEAVSKAGLYIKNEWDVFQNVISSLVRDRWEYDTKIWLLGNPLSKWDNPYFRNMGITKALLEKPNITKIEYPQEKKAPGRPLSTVFAYIGLKPGEVDQNRQALYNTFFAFPNSTGRSITDGIWEMDECARIDADTLEDSTRTRTVYAAFEEEKLQIDIMRHDNTGRYYLYISPTEHILPGAYYMILGTSLDRFAIVGRDARHPIARLVSFIEDTGQVYYADNMTADAWHGFRIEQRRYRA